MKTIACLVFSWTVGIISFFGGQFLLGATFDVDMLTAWAMLPLFVPAAVVYPLGMSRLMNKKSAPGIGSFVITGLVLAMIPTGLLAAFASGAWVRFANGDTQWWRALSESAGPIFLIYVLYGSTALVFAVCSFVLGQRRGMTAI